ncbi:MAG TPA: DUF4465 domain-containing protein [Bacteroidales bacterium]|nr:DUF4465 domain-containing protein [Bacteroidales bacterium]
MKKIFYLKKNCIKCIFFIFIVIFFTVKVNSQTVSSFEEFSLPVDTVLNGSDFSGGFNSGLAFFPNYYDTVWDYWEGFAISTMRDDSTQGLSNLYSAITGNGYNSTTYAVAYLPAVVKFNGFAKGNIPLGCYVTNSTYAYYTMLYGDLFSKKFGGPTGDDPDWFLLSIINYYNGQIIDTVDFYLADYRFQNNMDDYIVNTWEWIDLSPLGPSDSLLFVLSSSDTSIWGMNTPAFFCIDNLTINAFTGFSDNIDKQPDYLIYPNPTKDFIHIYLKEKTDNVIVKLINSYGKIVFSEKLSNKTNNTIEISSIAKGFYIVEITTPKRKYVDKIIVE